MKSRDDDIHRLLSDLGRAIVQALSESSEVDQAVRSIRREGYQLNLALNCKQDDTHSAQIQLSSRERNPQAPLFRLDGNDVAFLKSVGIDATRPARRRR